MVSLGWIFFFVIFLGAFWVLLFLFTIVVPGAINLFFLNKIAPKFVKDLADSLDDK